MEFSLRVVFCVTVALLTAPIASQGQCVIPTEQDVDRVGEDVFNALISEGGPVTITLIQMQFTCLATASLNMYTSASVVISFTTNINSNTQVQQFQLICDDGVWVRSTTSFFDMSQPSLPSMPFDIETELGCYLCEDDINDRPANYDFVTNCFECDPVCANIGSGRCITTPTDCCPFYNSADASCVDNCTMIDPNFGPNKDFICVCNISCPSGFAANSTNCSCMLVDGCEAAGQPCNEGTCMSDLSASPPYSCNCTSGFSGSNCEIIPCHEQCQNCSSTDGCCLECNDGYMVSDCQCVTVTEPTTEPPTSACPDMCRDCDRDGCCTACEDGYTVRTCECVADPTVATSRTLATSQVAGIAIGAVLGLLMLLALAVLLAYIVYYVWANKEKMKKGTALSPFSNGESHSNPLYLNPEELGGDE